MSREAANARQRAHWARLTPEQKRLRAETNRRAQLKRFFDMTPEQYDERLAEQGGGCAICGSTEPRKGRSYLPVDHNHKTGVVRGILCEDCNRGLGCFKDDPDRLMAAAQYLIKHWRKT